ncbi:MAG: D-sedoheptulose 7-phosphate isomerase [Acidobacteriota bacterium]
MSLRAAFAEHSRVVEASMATLIPRLEEARDLAAGCLRRGGKLLACGNGGSAADAQHFAAEFVGRFELERQPLAAIALTTDSSILTSLGNDYGYEQIFARQVAALARPGDLLFAISTSGNSPNVVAAARQARTLDCPVVGLTGEGGGVLAEAADCLLAVPSQRTSRIQEAHILCLHALIEAIELDLCGAAAEAP